MCDGGKLSAIAVCGVGKQMQQMPLADYEYPPAEIKDALDGEPQTANPVTCMMDERSSTDNEDHWLEATCFTRHLEQPIR